MASRDILLMEVGDSAGELAVWRDCPAFMQRGLRIAPLVELGRFRAQLEAIAEAHGYRLRVMPYQHSLEELEETDAFLPSQDTIDLQCRFDKRIPSIVPIGEVDQRVVSFAHHLAGSRLFTLDDLLSADRDQVQSVLLLFDGDAADLLRRAASHLQNLSIPFGLLPMLGDATDHLAVAKALLFPEVEIDGIDWFETLKPSFASDVRWGESSESRTTDSRRLLVLSGHGNAVDLGKAGIVLCARGRSETVSSHVYPCFRDGLCFRQPIFKRPPQARDGLVNPESLHHAVVLLLGCGTMPIGNTPFDMSATLFARLNGSQAIAGSGTLGILYADRDVELMLVALLIEGLPLGEAVLRFNDWHERTYGATSPDRDFGPLVAYGNPEFRLRSSLMPTLIPERQGSEVAMPISSSATTVALFKTATSSNATYLVRHSAAGTVWLSAVQMPSQKEIDQAVTYLAVRSNSAIAAGSVDLSPIDLESFSLERQELLDSVPYLPLWGVLLSAIEDERSGGGEAARYWSEADELRGRMEKLVLRYLSSARFKGDRKIVTEDLIATDSFVLSIFSEFQRTMLSVVSAYIRETGAFVFHLWSPLYLREDGSPSVRSCPVCSRLCRFPRYRSHLSVLDVHELVQCSACGVLGEVPRAIDVALEIGDPTPTGNSIVQVQVAIRNQRSSPVRGFVAILREDWFRSRFDSSEVAECRIPADRDVVFLFEIALSSELTAGLYPLTVVGVLNGGLVQVRSHLTVTRRDHHGDSEGY